MPPSPEHRTYNFQSLRDKVLIASAGLASLGIGGSILAEEGPVKQPGVVVLQTEGATALPTPLPIETSANTQTEIGETSITHVSLSVASTKVSVEKKELPAFVRASVSKGKNKCMSFRRKPNDIYTGYGCKNSGDTFNPVGNVPLVKGWTLGVMVVDGIYKCGFGRLGVLPKKKTLRTNAATYCINYHPKLVETPFTYFKRLNCPEKKPCRDGTYHSKIKKNCPDPRSFRNYATDEPSPFNMYGTGNGGFSDLIEENLKTSTRYRVEIKQGSKDGKAAIVRGPEWGMTLSKCIPLDQRKGGTLEETRRR